MYCLASNIRSDSRYTRDITFVIFLCKIRIQQDEEPFHEQIGLKFQEETGKMLQPEYSFVQSDTKKTGTFENPNKN